MLCISIDAPCTATCSSEQACVNEMCLNVDKLGIALTWSRPGDGDLVVTTPNNKHIYWENTGPGPETDGGYLDVDDLIGKGPENIYWPESEMDPPAGTYNVCFEPFSFANLPTVANPVYATITVRRPMGVTLTFKKTVTEKYSFNRTCYPSSNGYLGSFTYP